MKMPVKEFVSVIKKKEGGDSELESLSSDSEQESDLKFSEESGFDETPDEKNNKKKIIEEINLNLEKNKKIDLSLYPPLFVVHYRGVHFFNQFFTKLERREVRRKIKAGVFQDGIYSPAVYELAHLKIGEPIDTKEKKERVREAVKKLNESFDTLSNRESKEGSWFGNKKQHDELIFQHYQRYVNNYSEFRDESEEKRRECYTVLPATKNPYISTADGSKHAVMYALGGKAKRVDGCLRPDYIFWKQEKNKKKNFLRAAHPKVGYVQIILHTLQSLIKKNPLFLSVLQASSQVDIKNRVLNERETTFKSSVKKKYIAHTEIVRLPSFNVPHRDEYHSKKYGINATGFGRYRTALSNLDGETGLVDKIAEHYAKRFDNIAKYIAKERGGFVVYMGLDGRLRENLPPTSDISKERSNGKGKDLFGMFKHNLSQYVAPKENSDSEEASDESLSDAPVKDFGKKDAGVEKISKERPRLELKNALEKAARLYGFKCKDVFGDGNCFFHAVVDQFEICKIDSAEVEEVKTHADLRAKIIKFIQEHIGDYREFFDAPENDYISTMAKNGTWVDHVMIQAAADLFSITIVVINNNGDDPHVIKPKNDSVAVIYLGYEVGVHYQSLVPDQDSTNRKVIDLSISNSIKPNKVSKEKVSKQDHEPSPPDEFFCQDRPAKMTETNMPAPAAQVKRAIPGIEAYEIGLGLFNQGCYKASLPYFLKSAEKGYPFSYLRLGWLYEEDGRVGRKNSEQSKKWYEKAAKEIKWYESEEATGNPEAIFLLGLCYRMGVGVTEDLGKAVAFYQRSAEKKYPQAEFNLGSCYYHGKGVEINLEQACFWFQRSANQGYADAQSNLGTCYQTGNGVKKDLKKAYFCYEEAANKGHAIAQYNLGMLFYGVENDFKQAKLWFQKSADQGYARAQYNLGVMLLENENNLKEAIIWFQKSADQGYARAQYNLGVLSHNVEKNLKKATLWVQKAADQGDEEAIKWLAELKKSDAYLLTEQGVFKSESEQTASIVLPADKTSSESITPLQKN